MTDRRLPPLRMAPDLRVRPWAGARLAPAEQHIGEACIPSVKAGDQVARGDVVGRPPVRDGRPALGDLITWTDLEL